jgi:hypothetical protein
VQFCTVLALLLGDTLRYRPPRTGHRFDGASGAETLGQTAQRRKRHLTYRGRRAVQRLRRAGRRTGRVEERK